MAKVKVGILGSGNIGTDLMYKLVKSDGNMELALVAGIDPGSEGLARAQAKGIRTSSQGIDAILAEQAKLMEAYGADCVYVVDSAGALVQTGVRERVAALKEALSIEVGFHAHNNLGLAMGNTLTALEAGADQIDGTLR